jgi:RNA polymerase sigma-70 factor (ECF subfamily)
MDNLAVEEEGPLIARAAAGDAAAFDELIRPRLDRLYVTAHRILRDGAAAEDAVQQAMVLAWRDLGALRDHGRLDPWLYRLLVRTCYRELRSRRRLAANVVQLERRDDPDATLAVHDRDALERAFRRLSADKRAVVVLHHVTGLSLIEIAGVLGVPEGTVRSRLHYGLQELRRVLAPAGIIDRVEEPA